MTTKLKMFMLNAEAYQKAKKFMKELMQKM